MLIDFFGQFPASQILSSDNASSFGFEFSSMLAKMDIRHNSYTANMSKQRGAIETQIKYFRQILRILVLNVDIDSNPVEQLKLLLVCTANSMNSHNY